MKSGIWMFVVSMVLLCAGDVSLSAQEIPSPAESSVAPVPTRVGSSSMDRIYVGVGGGYGGISLAEAERNLELLIRSEREYFESYLLFWGSGVVGTPIARMQEVTGGAYLMTEAGYRIKPRLSAGVRFFRYFVPDLTGLLEENGSGGESIRAEHTFTVGLTKLLFGASLERAFSNEALHFRVGAHAGPVFLRSDQTLTFEVRSIPFMDTLSYTWTVPYGGMGLGVDLGMQVEYRFAGSFGVYAEAGYSLANLPEVRVREDVDLDQDGSPDFRKGDILQDVDGSPIECDLGGLRAGCGLRALF